MKKLIFASVAIFAGILTFGCQAKNSSASLKVYSIVHEEETQALADLFTEKTGIQVEYVKAATGELINRVIAEKDAPQADVLLGGLSSMHSAAAEQGALAKYESPAAKNFPGYAKDSQGFWSGLCVLTLGIGVNTERFEKNISGAEFPETWDDLLDARYDGEIVLTDPVASSTAYLFVQNQLQRLGWENGWAYLLELAQLVGQFPSSGGAPPRLIGSGEYAICVAYIHALAKYKAEGFPITIIAPPQSAAEVDAVSVIKNAPNEENAKKFVDFVLSEEAQSLFSKITHTIPVNSDAQISEDAVSLAALDLIKYDAELAKKQRDEVLLRWQTEVR